MPRGYQNPITSDQDRDADDWRALRGELVELLEQVEGQYVPGDEEDIDALTRRVEALRRQVNPATNRQRDALRSVQRAVDRFNDRDETPPNPRDSLQSAILEIRSRQHGLAAPNAAQRETDARARQVAEEARIAAEEAAQRAADLAARRAAEQAAREAEEAALRAEQRAAEEAALRRAEQRAAEEAAARRAEQQRQADEVVRRENEMAARRATEAARRAGEIAERRAAEAASERAVMAAAERAAEAAAQRAAERSLTEIREFEAASAKQSESIAARVSAAAEAAAETAARKAVEASARLAVEHNEEYRKSNAAHFGELANAVGGIAGRMERFEDALRAQAGTSVGNLREVADQVGQLTSVVELLAGAVGETGQVKRIEAQIADVTDYVKAMPKLDLGAVSKRIEDLSKTVERLAEVQVESLNQERKQASVRSESMTQGIANVEERVRAIYDRFDSIEKAVAMSPAELERLTSVMTGFSEALGRLEGQPNTLLPLLDTLASRIGEIEGRDDSIKAISQRLTGIEDRNAAIEALTRRIEANESKSSSMTSLGERLAGLEARDDALTGLKTDIASLRQSLVAAVEPRFAAIESRIDKLDEKIATQPVGEGGASAGLEAIQQQIASLVSRMDDTGEHLTQLATFYSDLDKQMSAPDYDAIATMVAKKTSEAMAKSAQSLTTPPKPQGLDATSLDELERRMSALFTTTSRELPADEFNEVQDGIRKVDEKLDRLEAALKEQRIDTPVAEAPIVPRKRDAMPVNPAEDAPLIDKGTGALVTSALAAKAAQSIAEPVVAKTAPKVEAEAPQTFGLEREEIEKVLAEPEFDAVRTPYDASKVDRPAKPASTLGDDAFTGGSVDMDFDAPAEFAPPVVEETPQQSTRNTFIEAHRRAAQQRSGVARRDVHADSLIGKALARFQTESRPAEATAIATPISKDETPTREPRFKLGLGKKDKADKPAKPEKKAKAEKAAVVPEVESPLHTSGGETLTVGDTTVVANSRTKASARVKTEFGKQSFLMRYRQPILLGATAIAVSLLALNLIGQRMAASKATPAPTATEAPAEPAAATTDTPAASTGNTSLVVPSDIDSGEALTSRMADLNASANAAVDAARDAAEQVIASAQPAIEEAIDPITTAAIPSGQDLDAAASAALASAAPIKAEMPPEQLGPVELRQAAADGDARAQFEVAAIYTEGSIVKQDFAAAARWYENSANQGFAPAQYRLGSMFESGKGVDKDFEKARLWYEKAAQAGNRMSMHNLAALYAGGELGEQNFDEAAKWFRQAADRGMTDSQFNLGMLYARGLGVDQSLGDSYKWFSLAAMSGDKDAAKARDDVLKSLDPATAAAVDDELSAWAPASIDLAANFAPIGTWTPTFDPGTAITNKDVVIKVQQALHKLGYDVGTPDGLAGPRTADAIKSFEKATGMSESGAINPRLLAVLGSQPV